MNVLEQAMVAVQSLGQAARQLGRASLWSPWLPVLALQAGVIVCLWWFAHPAVSWFMSPVLIATAGEAALRYPNVFQLMPALFARADLAIAVLVGAVAAGASTARFAERFGGSPESRSAAGRALSRAPALIVASLPFHGLVLGVSFGLQLALPEGSGSSMLSRVAPLVGLGVAVLAQAFFLYLTPLLMVGGLSLADAFRALPDALRRGSGAAITLAVLVTLPLVPFHFLAPLAGRIVERGVPEMVGWLLVAQVTLSVVLAFLFVGGSTLAYQSIVARDPEAP